MPTIIQTVAGPSVVFTIGDLAAEVILKVENRTSDLARTYSWLRDALIEISSNPDHRNEFDELERLGPPFSLTAGLQEYDQANIVPAGDVNAATLDIFLWRDFPTNRDRKQLDMTSYQAADAGSSLATGTPTEWYRFGSNIGFYMTPDKDYQVQSRILRMHPISDDSLQTTQILLPRDWNEILIYAAAERGFIEIDEYEKAAGIHNFLFGDPKHPDRPGLIASRKKRREREDWRKQKSLSPVVMRYGPR